MGGQDLCSTVSYIIRSGHRAAGSAPPELTFDHLAAFLSGDRILAQTVE